MVERANECELFRGTRMGKNTQQVEVSHLFFTGDSRILCQPDVEMVQNLRVVLVTSCFPECSNVQYRADTCVINLKFYWGSYICSLQNTKCISKASKLAIK